ncbi:hypothetical protein AMTR_s00001p00272520 [Amborella trichopoda]|uniref:ARM repeat N-terminal plant domain-containing protein n=1 Tax=Amborella trichopoda TaxID=13333 RepID=W1NMY9_AMBTC|nr:hypothetical protein AMTR_s00001p00272520 [Amborella trichopoda]
MAFKDRHESVLVLSALWNLAMTQPDDPEFPRLGIFKCMAVLIYRALKDDQWLLRDQNIYIPYYAAHIIGSYTMNKEEFAEEAVREGVIPPLMELLRGKMSWVEQRVAIRALGHLASYDKTFGAVSADAEIVGLAINLSRTSLGIVYDEFRRIKEKRVRYHCDLLTRGMGGEEMEDRKAEEWASQLQCWSVHLLSCFAYKGRLLRHICEKGFLKELCTIWGGLPNQNSPSGVGLIRVLCYSKVGRSAIAETKEVMDTAATALTDLAELRNLSGRKEVGSAISGVLLRHGKNTEAFSLSTPTLRSLEELSYLKLRSKREKAIAKRELQQRKTLAKAKKLEGNLKFLSGDIEEAILKYTEALEICPLRAKKARVVLYSNRAQCHLILQDADTAISDCTRSLCLGEPPNSHSKSLWRRSQAYDMKGLAKESLMDVLMFVNARFLQQDSIKMHNRKVHRIIPYFAARMINKQMRAIWLFARNHHELDVEEGSQRETASEDIARGNLNKEFKDKANRKSSVSGFANELKSLPTIREGGRREKQVGGDEAGRLKDGRRCG